MYIPGSDCSKPQDGCQNIKNKQTNQQNKTQFVKSMVAFLMALNQCSEMH